MLSSTSLSLFAWLLLLPQQSLAAIHRRQDATASTIPTAATASATPIAPDTPKTTLEPVLPPDNDPEDFGNLSPDKSLKLFYGGVPNATLAKRDDPDAGILVNLDFTFLHPSVSLDSSSFISGVVCSDNNTMTGVISTAAAYAYVKNAWNGLDNLLLITSADGCGADTQNDVFLASSITFSDSDLSFTATGEENLVKDVAETSDITWGNVTPKKLKKRSHRRGQSAQLEKRICFEHCSYGNGFDVSLGIMLADQEGMEVDEDAPWDNAVLLASFGPEEDGSEDGDGSEGGESKRSVSTTDLAERDGLDYGLKLYCVDCGFQGTASATGSIGINFAEMHCYRAKVTLTGNMYAGLFLGMEMFVEYSKTYSKDFIREYLNPWEIPLILEFGPYIRVGVEATIDIKAEGTLLLGASATWGGFESVMDFLHPEKSTSQGFEPAIERKAEANVELSAEATLGLPVGIGLGVTVFSVWSVDVELTDTPALYADATFTASVDANDCQGSGCPEDTDDGDDDDDCDGGIAWSVGFQNTLAVSVTGFDPYTIDEYKPDPLASGCINILGGNGTDSDNSPSGGSCTPGITVPASSPSGTCGAKGAMLIDQSPRMGPQTNGGSLTQCATRCLKHGCASFGYNSKKQTCRMYSAAVSDLQIKPSRKSNKSYYDAGCYEETVCPEAA